MKKRYFFLILLLAASNKLYAAAQVTEAYVSFTPVTVTKSKAAAITINLPYSKSTYLLAFTTFLANGDIPGAIAVAQKATKADPNDLFWHEKLAQVAVWDNDTSLAMQQLVIILNVKKDKATLDQLVQLGAYTSHFKDVITAGEAYLPKYPKDDILIAAMVASYNGLAEPDKVIDLIQKVIKYNPKKVYFNDLIAVYSTLQDNTAVQKTAMLQKKLEGTSADNALTLTDTYYAKNDLQGAQQVLLQAAPRVSPKRTDFWRVLADNAWLLNDFRVVLYAYHMLEQTNKLGVSDHIQFIQILFLDQPNRAIDQSMRLWEKNHDKNGLILASNYLDSYYNLPLALYFFSRLSKSGENALADTISFWGAKSQFLQNLNENDAAQTMLMTQMKKHPAEPAYQLLYLNFLINQIYYATIPDTLSLLQTTLIQWAYKVNEADNWANAYANAYLVLNNLLFSYEIDRSIFANQKENLDYLDSFSSTSEGYGYHKNAKILGLYTLNLIKKNQLDKDNVDIYRIFLGLGEPYLSVDDYFQGLCWLTHQPGNQNKEPLLDWALANGQLPLADAVANSYNKAHYPAWAQLKLAMQHNDVQEMYRLLLLHPTTLPKDDLVTAANQINDISLAGLTSVQTLRVPTAELDRNTPQMIELTTAAANSVSLSQEYDIYGFLQGNKTQAYATFNMGNNVTLEPFESAWFTQSWDQTQLTNVPDVDQELGLKYTKQTQNNWYQWVASLRDDLATFATLSFEDRYYFNPNLNLDMQFGYNQVATQTTTLWITSVQDIANFQLNYDFSSFDNIAASANGSEFYSQEGTYVGDSLQLMLQANHKFWLAYPDFTVGWFGEIDKFGQTGSVSPFMAQVIPADQTADLTAFIPQNYWQSGVTFNFGDNLLKTRTDRFRPYGDISWFYNSVSGDGYDADVGLVGSVLGCDQLNLYASRSKNSGGLAQINEIFGIQYKYFYG
ncbi:MAG: tetratricopeptide repeat protein [Legionellales bacterium]|nr:tetratricopeptide repeat protein [Legionellales bacterium]